MSQRNEAQTRFDLIDPALRVRSWDHPTGAFSTIKVEERDVAVEIINGKARRRATQLTGRRAELDRLPAALLRAAFAF